MGYGRFLASLFPVLPCWGVGLLKAEQSPRGASFSPLPLLPSGGKLAADTDHGLLTPHGQEPGLLGTRTWSWLLELSILIPQGAKAARGCREPSHPETPAPPCRSPGMKPAAVRRNLARKTIGWFPARGAERAWSLPAPACSQGSGPCQR